MKEYKRNYPFFSLCGLPCGLCPRHQTDSKSKCPGCGGEEFHLKHPSCSVITCNKKHDSVEYCFLCSEYPCEKYSKISEKDSFISYRNVLNDFRLMKEIGEEQFIETMNKRILILEELIENYKDGRKKSFFCVAANLLPIEDLNKTMKEIKDSISKSCYTKAEEIRLVVDLIKSYSKSKNIELSLRK